MLEGEIPDGNANGISNGNPNGKALDCPGHRVNSTYVHQKPLRIRSLSVPPPSGVDQERPAPDLRHLYKNVPLTGWAMELQPDTQPVTLDQLKTEVRAVYIGTVKVETLCSERIAAYKQANEPLSEEQWRSLVGLHKATVHEFADFFFATQHPAAMRSRTLRESRLKYSMPQRLWQRVQSLLDLMRRHLPASREHMAGFISLSFTIFTVLYEHATDLQAVWSECLGDVARFGMAIQDSFEERGIWVGSSRMWYLRAIDLKPGVGRLSHHLAILARPEPMGQLFHFTKSLCAVTPFGPARESISTLFNPIFSQEAGPCQGLDTVAVKLHGMLMMDHAEEDFETGLMEYMFALSDSIAADPVSWESFGYYLAVVNVSSLLSYCSEANPVARALGVVQERAKAKPFGFEASEASVERAFERAVAINLVTVKTMLRHEDVSPLLSYLHVWLAFLHSVSKLPPHQIPPRVLSIWPWDALSLTLGAVEAGSQARARGPEFSSREGGPPLPEDYAMRGLVWAGGYLPGNWFEGDGRDQDERVVEGPWGGWVREERAGRCVWLEGRVAEVVMGRSGRIREAFSRG